MATAGYCHDCAAWTWEGASGGCVAGHPADRMTDRYEAQPVQPAGNNVAFQVAFFVFIAGLLITGVGLYLQFVLR